MNDHAPLIKHVVDVGAVGVMFGALAGWLPPLAALITIAWGLQRFYDRHFGRDRTRPSLDD